MERKERNADNSLVSIVIPVYNVESYVGKCLESVLGQTYSNIEVICVDDASTDNSLSILNMYSKLDERIQILVNEKNEGPPFSRNTGFKQAKGKYIYFLDSDDYIELNAIEKLYKYAEEYDTECVYFNSRLLSEGAEFGKGVILNYGLENINRKVYDGPTLFKILKENGVYTSSVWRRFWRTDFLINNKLDFENELRTSEDGPFSAKAILYGKRMMIVDETYHVYRRREGAITTEAGPIKMICVFKGYCILLDFWQKHHFSSEINEVISEHLKSMLIIAKKLYLRNRNEVNKDNFEEGLERHLFEMLIVQDYEKSLDNVDDYIVQKIRKYRKVIVFGAYIYAAEVVEKLVRKGIEIDCLAVTQMHEKAEGINGIPVYEIEDLRHMRDKAIVVLGVGKRNREDVINTLVKYGFMNYVSID